MQQDRAQRLVFSGEIETALELLQMVEIERVQPALAREPDFKNPVVY